MSEIHPVIISAIYLHIPFSPSRLVVTPNPRIVCIFRVNFKSLNFSSNLLFFSTIIFALAIDVIPKKLCYSPVLHFNFRFNVFSLSLSNASYLGDIFCASVILGKQEALALCVLFFKHIFDTAGITI